MARNKVEYFGETLIDLTDTTAVASDVAQGKYFYGADGVKTIGTSSGGGGSEPELIASTTVTVSTTSTSAASVTTINLGASAWRSDKILYVKIRDINGARDGYFYGSDTFIYNYQATDGATASSINVMLRNIYSRTTGSLWYQYNGATSTGYGVYPSALAKSTGTLTISRRYNATYSKIIDGTYTVDVYLMDYPVDNPYESDIPSAYERVLCLGGSKNAYIDTGLNMDGDYEFEVTVKLDLTDGVKYQAYAVTGMESTSSRQGGRFDITADGAQRFVGFWVGKSSFTTYTIDADVDITGKLTLVQNKEGFTITDENGNSTVKTYTGTSGTAEENIRLFSYRTTGLDEMIYIYIARISKNGTILRDFVPVRRKSDSVLGMYDKIGDQFYTAVGSGEFVVGE